MSYIVDLEHRFTNQTKPVFNRTRGGRYFKTAHAARIAGIYVLAGSSDDWRAIIRLERDARRNG